MKELLFDASSMIRAIKERKVDLLIKGNIQPLTIYEVLNAFWKEAYLIRTISKETAIKATTLISELIKEMKILTITGLEKEIIELALNLGLTAYDASYVILAKKNNLVLVTEDEEIHKKARNLVKVAHLDDIKSSTSP